MREAVLRAIRRNRDIAAKAGQLERVERLDARLAELEKPAPPKRSRKKKPATEPVEEQAAEPAAEEPTPEPKAD